MKQILNFPKNFYWGSSTSSHQVEGNNFNDWTVWEKENAERLAHGAKDYWQPWQVNKFPEMLESKNYISGKACDHYNRYEEDFDIAQLLNQNAHRFSIEWSRIEPKEGQFDEKEIEHYRKVVKALKKRGLEPFVTLWHWTNPIWIKDIGGWENKKTVAYFTRYVEKIASELGKDIQFWITLNEPTILDFNSYLVGTWPPQKKCPRSFLKVESNLMEAHKKAFDLIHEISPSSRVGFAHNVKFIEPKHKFCILDQIVSHLYKYFANNRTFKLAGEKYDFIGLNYYFHDKIRFYKGKWIDLVIRQDERNDMNWEIYPEGIYHVLKSLTKYDKPIYITENGLADKTDKKRSQFIKDYLFWTHKAIDEGVDVRGYFHWSLLDNFEWDKGFWPRFGLVEVDRKTLKRTVRPSAKEYAKICNKNSLNYKAQITKFK